MEKISILLVDDHQMVRMGLKAYFDTLEDIEVIGEAGSGYEALTLLEANVPDVVLMDLIMPEIDGIETTRKIKEISPGTQVIVLTSYHDDDHIFPAIKAGALSYLLKDVDPDNLADAIHKATIGEAVLNPQIAARLMEELKGGRKEASLNAFAKLTSREVEVLQIIAKGKSNQEIAETLVISEKTVKSHVSNILRKLHLADRTQAAVYAWREGFVSHDNQ